MTSAIWKFPLVISDRQVVSMPTGTKTLSVKLQGQDTMLWALVDPAAPMVNRVIHCYGTGHVIKQAGLLQYIDTVVYREGHLIFHYFVEPENGQMD